MVRAIPFGKLLKTHVWALVCGDNCYSVSAKTTDSILQLRVAFILAFYLSLKLPWEQRLLSSMAFSFHEVFSSLVGCVVGLFTSTSLREKLGA